MLLRTDSLDEVVESVDRLRVKSDVDQDVADEAATRPTPSRRVDEQANALVARPRNVELLSQCAASPIGLRDRNRAVVELNEPHDQVRLETGSSGVHA